MKQNIACDACAKQWRKAIGKYPGEDVRVLEGKARRDFDYSGLMEDTSPRSGLTGKRYWLLAADGSHDAWFETLMGLKAFVDAQEGEHTFVLRSTSSSSVLGEVKLAGLRSLLELVESCGHPVIIFSADNEGSELPPGEERFVLEIYDGYRE